MPIKHAALKQIRKDKVRAQRNQAARSELKTYAKQFIALLKTNKTEEAKSLLSQLAKQYDRASAKGLIHRNTASRVKSRLSLQLNRTKTS